MKRLTKTDIMGAADIRQEIVEVPEWGGEALVYGLTGAERDEFEESIFVSNSDGKTAFVRTNIRAKLCSYAIREDDGRRMFDEDEVDELGKRSAVALDRIYTVAQRLSGITKEDIKALEKNLETAQSGGSGLG
jgi:hypothetical protein